MTRDTKKGALASLTDLPSRSTPRRSGWNGLEDAAVETEPDINGEMARYTSSRRTLRERGESPEDDDYRDNY